MSKVQKIVLSVLVILVVVILCLFIFDTFGVKKKNIKHIKYKVVDKLYTDMEKTKPSKGKKYVSKLYGYSNDEKDVITMYTKEGYVLNNEVYDLNDKKIGTYDAKKINQILENGTTKTYKFTKESGKYKIKK